MKRRKMTSSLLTLFIIFIWFRSPSQTFCDTLFTLQGDTIPCIIKYINGQNIFYHQKIKKRIVEDQYIARSQLIAFALHNTGVTVPPQVNDSLQPESPMNFSENDGIIYASNCENPPSYKGGIGALYSHLENYVSVINRDVRIYENNVVTVLYQLVILDDGKIFGGGITESLHD